MKETLIAIAVVVIVGISGLALAQMMGHGGGCCNMGSHQVCPIHHHQM